MLAAVHHLNQQQLEPPSLPSAAIPSCPPSMPLLVPPRVFPDLHPACLGHRPLAACVQTQRSISNQYPVSSVHSCVLPSFPKYSCWRALHCKPDANPPPLRTLRTPSLPSPSLQAIPTPPTPPYLVSWIDRYGLSNAARLVPPAPDTPPLRPTNCIRVTARKKIPEVAEGRRACANADVEHVPPRTPWA